MFINHCCTCTSPQQTGKCKHLNLSHFLCFPLHSHLKHFFLIYSVPLKYIVKLTELMSSTKIYIVYYSLYGHVVTMAREVHRGASSVEGVEATLWQVPETLPEKILEKMKAPAKEDDIPVISPEQLKDADGFLFGFPSRFGMMPAQCKAFFDSTYELWETQSLAGKPAGIFWSTGFHGGGQENTAFWTLLLRVQTLRPFSSIIMFLFQINSHNTVGTSWDVICSTRVHFRRRHV
ncbi:probable NAD(P)H dehydrogenase (quinone) FQR1-like 3 isoform X2 [Papaver somniferum]|uniref:probable NAD(P)H dehydrogenase (quinone) FQR1-like 3 isoform X2 n=1 Tax=Papaver somniferum TaxID=3469 RepID=UPI000E705670|nr:probable NAD(P)H dehydrogenase (quinone) FQR1-like 3 isoform X2 [Papaver somniferum]